MRSDATVSLFILLHPHVNALRHLLKDPSLTSTQWQPWAPTVQTAEVCRSYFRQKYSETYFKWALFLQLPWLEMIDDSREKKERPVDPPKVARSPWNGSGSCPCKDACSRSIEGTPPNSSLSLLFLLRRSRLPQSHNLVWSHIVSTTNHSLAHTHHQN